MSGAQYLRQLLAPLGVYDLEGPFQNGELEALGEALDQAEAALDELHRESCLATAQDWGLERTASLFRRRPIAATPKAMREALAALLRIGGDSFTLDAINDTISGCGVNARVRETGKAGTVEVSFPKVPGIRPALTRSKRSWRTSSRPICWYSTTFGISPGPSWSLNFPAGRRLRTRPSHGPGWRPMWSRRMDPDKRRRGPRILSCGSPSFFYFWASSVSSVWTISKTRASQCSFRVTPASLARVSRAAHSVA